MFKNYLTTAYRNLMRFKLDSFLNISGLVIGLGAALLIALFIRHETSYDGFWQQPGQVYRIQTRWVMQGRDDIDIVQSSGPLKTALENYFPDQLQTVARLHIQNPVVYTESESFTDLISFADPEILDIFDFKILSGDARAALSGNASIILSETLAKKYFGDLDPLGKTLTLDYRYLKRDYQVLAVMRDLPRNTHLDIQAMVKIDENDFIDNDGSWMFSDWNAANNHTYLRLKPGAGVADMERQIADFTDTSVPDPDDKASEYTRYKLLSVPDIHLHSQAAGSMKPGGDNEIILAFGVIALLIVMVATINYVNLSTARAGQRAREVAIRKVMGAKRAQLVTQYLGESMLMVALAILMAVISVELALPFFNQMLKLELVLELGDPVTVVGLLSSLLIVGGLSGCYPALILSSYRPSGSLRANRSTQNRGTVKARNVLVVFQTTVTVCLIVATTVVYAQLTYFRSLERGFDPDRLLVIQDMSRNGVVEKRETFKDEVAKLRGIDNVALSYEAPTKFNENNVRVWIPGEDEEISYPLGSTNVDSDYLNTLEIPLLAGRFYKNDRALDQMPSTDQLEDGDVLQGNIVVNARAVEVMGLGTPKQAVGQEIETRYRLDDDGMAKVHLTIVGVIGNTKMHSAKTAVRPEVYQLQPYYHHMLVRYSGHAPEVLAQIRNTWLNMMPGEPFEYFYAEQALAEEFQSEVNQANIFLGFALLTMMVGCLGLYGLAAFVTECRRPEIGIRKIMGAHVGHILALLFGQFSWLVIVANLIAWPLAYVLMNDWLQQYPFRIGNGWIMVCCVIAGMLASIIVAMTVGSQAWGVARANPIHAIRQE